VADLLTRRQLLASVPALTAITAVASADAKTLIDRQTLLGRHDPVLHDIDIRSPLSVGNGQLAFTTDVTGLQSLPDLYEPTIPLCTQSQWGWHSFPSPDGRTQADLRLESFDTYGRQVGYATSSNGQEGLFNWLRENPHRLNLGRIGLLLDGAPLVSRDITNINQRLDLWTGILTSRFLLQGQPVLVVTCCPASRDAIAIQVASSLVPIGRLVVQIDFPYGSPAITASDWNSRGKHTTKVQGENKNGCMIGRQLDADHYWVRLYSAGNTFVNLKGTHQMVLGGDAIDFTCEFTRDQPTAKPLPASAARKSSEHFWRDFWSRGGAIDLSGSTDPRAEELERRIVLSQYLTAIQCSGTTPPQETGLTCNSWYGKFHLEMHWWHAAHFAHWSRTPLLERSMGFYTSILPVARDKATKQGYSGARWPKMTSPDGHDGPSNIGELLIWQQPHPIMLAELCYRASPSRKTLERYREIVMETADFMADFAVLRDGRFVLGPPVIPAQENHPPRETWNPTFELSYWREALGVAAAWRKRLGLPPLPKWDDVRTKLAPLPIADGVYLAHENCPQTYTARNSDHPSMLGALGMLKGEGVDAETMRRTLHKVLKEWRWADTWGWDFPMAAMTATKLGEPETAIDCLFIESPKNTWLANGHNWQRDDLPVYLPGNGGLLAAVALMAVRGGFPKSWNVRWEGLRVTS
jgi:hypothetical protein